MEFPDTIEFFNVEGTPVTIGNIKGHPYSAAWDKPESRPFDPDSARRNGKPLSKDEFVAFVEKFLAEPQSQQRSPIADKPSLFDRLKRWLGFGH